MYEHPAGRDLKLSYEWLEFAACLPGAATPYLGLAANKQLIKGRYILQSIMAVNTSTAAQVITLADGEDGSGALVFQASVAASGTLFQPFGPRGVLCETGLFATLAGGPWNISVIGVPLWHYSNTPPGQ